MVTSVNNTVAASLTKNNIGLHFYRPQTKFAKVMFLQVSVCPRGGGVRGCSRGVCVVAPGGCGCLGGMCGCWGVACMVAPGGVCIDAPRGACMVAQGGRCAWLFPGGACVVAKGGVCGCSRGGVHGFFDEIRSMSGRYASYWNAFLSTFFLCVCGYINLCHRYEDFPSSSKI